MGDAIAQSAERAGRPAVTWELLPEGDTGITPVGGHEDSNLEEAHVLPLTGAGAPGLYVAGRSTVGWIVASSTADPTGRGGWAPSAYAQYADPQRPGQLLPLSASSTPFGGRLAGLKNPRGPITMKRFDGPSGAAAGRGAYLLLYYNNHNTGFTARDPYWLSAGWEVAGVGSAPPTVLWSQPEVALYDAGDHTDRAGYPDFVAHHAADGWDVYITETQKVDARVHKVDRRLLAGLWGQRNVSHVADGAAAELGPATRSIPTPAFPALDGSASAAPGVGGLGLAVSIAVDGHAGAAPGQTLLSSEGGSHGGIALVTGPSTGGAVTLRLSDGTSSLSVHTDTACSAALGHPGRHYIAASVDGGPRIATMMVDGVLCDGAGTEPQGWEWVPKMNASVRGAPTMRVVPDYAGTVATGHVYARMLTTSEMVGNYRAYAAMINARGG